MSGTSVTCHSRGGGNPDPHKLLFSSGLDTRLRGYDKRSSVLYVHLNRLCQQPSSLWNSSGIPVPKSLLSLNLLITAMFSML